MVNLRFVPLCVLGAMTPPATPPRASRHADTGAVPTPTKASPQKVAEVSLPMSELAKKVPTPQLTKSDPDKGRALMRLYQHKVDIINHMEYQHFGEELVCDTASHVRALLRDKLASTDAGNKFAKPVTCLLDIDETWMGGWVEQHSGFTAADMALLRQEDKKVVWRTASYLLQFPVGMHLPEQFEYMWVAKMAF